MLFGHGGGELFNRFTISLDVIGHDLTHGVTEDEARLIYFFQAGALNESISDVFGSLVKQHVLNRQNRITVEDGGRQHIVQLADPVEDPTLQQLLRFLQTKARSVQRRGE
jgi:Zn-dependent metalloprotease